MNTEYMDGITADQHDQIVHYVDLIMAAYLNGRGMDVIKDRLKRATREFSAHPSAQNFATLRACMYEWQYLRNAYRTDGTRIAS